MLAVMYSITLRYVSCAVLHHSPLCYVKISSKHGPSQILRPWELKLWENVHHMSHVTCYVSHVICHSYFFLLFFSPNIIFARPKKTDLFEQKLQFKNSSRFRTYRTLVIWSILWLVALSFIVWAWQLCKGKTGRNLLTQLIK